MRLNKILIHYVVLIPLALCCTGCWWYSFSGTSIDPAAQTISVGYIENRAERVNPALSNVLTEGLKDKYTKLTRLSVQSEDGDYAVTGEITGYDIRAMAVTADEVASQNRLTITVNIQFVNNLNPKENFEKQFSGYEDYASTMSFDAAESTLVDAISEKILDEIFNATVANW